MPAGTPTGWVVPNVSAFIKGLGLDCNCVNSFGDWTISDVSTSARSNTRRVNESDDSWFTQLDYSTPFFGGMTLRGNGGIRVVSTQEQAFGLASTAPFAQIKATHRYEDVLPSFNAALEVTPDIIARFGMAKVMSRPVLANLTPGVAAISPTAATPTVTVGNINLNPYRATNTDVSLEWYPMRGALVSLAYFDKKVENYAQQLTAPQPFGTTGLPLSLEAPGQDANTIYNVTTFRNTRGGYIRGYELNIQAPFTFLPGLLSNTGVLLNYTHINSRLGYFLSAGATTPFYAPFVGVSPDSYNATVFYDDGKLQARVSAAYRGEFIEQAGFIANLPDVRGGAAATNIDASASYKLTDHIDVKFDAINLTNQGTDDWSGETRKSQRVYSVTGRQFFLGAQYRF
jgi:TonB-dependent receptor